MRKRGEQKLMMEWHTWRWSKSGAEFCSVKTPMLWTSLLLFVFVMDFSKIRITVSFLSQTKYGYYCIRFKKKKKSVSKQFHRNAVMVILAKPWLNLPGYGCPD